MLHRQHFYELLFLPCIKTCKPICQLKRALLVTDKRLSTVKILNLVKHSPKYISEHKAIRLAFVLKDFIIRLKLYQQICIEMLSIF